MARLPGDIPSLAARYLAELARVHPSGPVLLAGASAGGAIVYEMARQLRLAGRPAALVAMLDTPSAADVVGLFTDDVERMYYAVGDRMGMTLDELRALPAAAQLARVLDATVPAAVRAYFDDAMTTRLLAVFKANEAAFGAYVPAPALDRLTYIRARTRRPRWDPARPEAAWLDLAHAGVDFDIVDGDHISMLHPPHVAALASGLANAIERAIARAPR